MSCIRADCDVPFLQGGASNLRLGLEVAHMTCKLQLWDLEVPLCN